MSLIPLNGHDQGGTAPLRLQTDQERRSEEERIEADIARQNNADGIEGRTLDQGVVTALLELAGGPSNPRVPRIKREFHAMVRSLAGSDPSPTEQLLCEVAGTNWLAMRVFELHHACAVKGSTPAKATDALDRRITRAQRRLTSALRTLAAIRRVSPPAIQVNVASQQVIANGPTRR